MREGFDLGGLRKHVERGHALERELAAKIGEIARQRRRIARDVEQRGCRMTRGGFRARRRRVPVAGGSTKTVVRPSSAPLNSNSSRCAKSPAK